MIRGVPVSPGMAVPPTVPLPDAHPARWLVLAVPSGLTPEGTPLD